MEENPAYLYAFACHEDERPLCEMELRALLGGTPGTRYALSGREIDVSRSPFVRERLKIEASSASLEEIAEAASRFELGEATFKVRYIEADGEVDYARRREIERAVGGRFRGRAEMKRPDRRYGVAFAGGAWVLGEYAESEPVWLRHNEKPRQYSTALGTRTARAVANIAVPRPEGVRAVDPCCGIGTVLIEALSMGIDMEGFDLNPLAAIGARENLAHFGLPGSVRVADMRKLEGRYDALVLDLPYNLCSVLSAEERLDMLRSARRLADRCVIVATQEIRAEIEAAGFAVQDSCIARKGAFARHILLCV
uniref:TRM11 family methyltransferase n=1 Tax=Saccharibacillus sp. CPCC 101409 TaxID=3058041 RepID=UPI0034A058B5